MADFQKIYATQADDYDLLVSREDFQGNLLRAIREIADPAGCDVVEFGAGTGRLTRQIVPLARSVQAFDAADAMLAVARERLAGLPENWTLAVADNAALRCEDNCADLVLAGWTFGHLAGWYRDAWGEKLAAVMAEIRRVLRPGGGAVIIETLGTGNTEPAPPVPWLAEFYQAFEEEYGFSRHAIRTDYRFESVDEAERLTRFFFGDILADRVRDEQLAILPECTGIWFRRFGEKNADSSLDEPQGSP
ncbi:class I SAM-dependent methyltransferase [bacterium]|nr:class I SAM-dependent methyltransferase [bacterium]